jgi:hypothetical protein
MGPPFGYSWAMGARGLTFPAAVSTEEGRTGAGQCASLLEERKGLSMDSGYE